MKIIALFKSGFSKLLANLKIILIIYIVNITLTILIAVPLYVSLRNDTAKREVRETLTSGFDYEWWNEFSFQAKGIEKTFIPSLESGFGPLLENFELILSGDFSRLGTLLFLLALVYMIINSFFAGGAIAIYADEKRKYSISRFFSNSAVFFNRYFSLTLTLLLLFILFFKVIHPAIFLFIKGITYNTISERLVFFLNFLGYLVFFILILFVNMVFDYAKVIVVVENRESAWQAIWWALKFVLKHFSKVMRLYYFLGLVAIGLAFTLALIQSVYNTSSVIVLVIAVIVQQASIFLKIGMRLLFYTAQLDMYLYGKSLVRRQPKA